MFFTLLRGLCPLLILNGFGNISFQCTKGRQGPQRGKIVNEFGNAAHPLADGEASQAAPAEAAGPLQTLVQNGFRIGDLLYLPEGREI